MLLDQESIKNLVFFGPEDGNIEANEAETQVAQDADVAGQALENNAGDMVMPEDEVKVDPEAERNRQMEEARKSGMNGILKPEDVEEGYFGEGTLPDDAIIKF